MTIDEARRVARAVAHADGGCGHCIGDLLERLESAFPGFSWTYDSGAAEPVRPPDDADWETEQRWYDERTECYVRVEVGAVEATR